MKLLWIDLEMTGLNVETERIIECAALVTDWEFNVVEKFEVVVKQPPEVLVKMDDWNQKHHSESGLLARIPLGVAESEVQSQLVQLIDRHWPNPKSKDDKPVLAGNSIGQDRLFINKYWPDVAAKLHYRMLDVTSWKVVFQAKWGLKFDKKNSHRAIDDIQESISELKFYLSQVDPKKVIR